MSLETFFADLTAGNTSTPKVANAALSTALNFGSVILDLVEPAAAPIVTAGAAALSTLMSDVQSSVAAAADPATATQAATNAITSVTTAAVNLLLQAKASADETPPSAAA